METSDEVSPPPPMFFFVFAENFVLQIKSQLMVHMANVHRIVQTSTQEYFEKFRRYVYVTPKSYLSFIKNYTSVYKKQVGCDLFGVGM